MDLKDQLITLWQIHMYRSSIQESHYNKKYYYNVRELIQNGKEKKKKKEKQY